MTEWLLWILIQIIKLFKFRHTFFSIFYFHAYFIAFNINNTVSFSINDVSCAHFNLIHNQYPSDMLLSIWNINYTIYICQVVVARKIYWIYFRPSLPFLFRRISLTIQKAIIVFSIIADTTYVCTYVIILHSMICFQL